MNEFRFIERQTPKTIIDFKSEPKHSLAMMEYKLFWLFEGERVKRAFKKVTGLPFLETHISANIIKGTKSNSGIRLSEPIELGADYLLKEKGDLLIHELTHRFIMQHDLWNKAKEKFSLEHGHQLLDVIYFEVLKQLYGRKHALKRAETERKWGEQKYKNCWDWFLQLNSSRRAEILKFISESSK